MQLNTVQSPSILKDLDKHSPNSISNQVKDDLQNRKIDLKKWIYSKKENDRENQREDKLQNKNIEQIKHIVKNIDFLKEARLLFTQGIVKKEEDKKNQAKFENLCVDSSFINLTRKMFVLILLNKFGQVFGKRSSFNEIQRNNIRDEYIIFFKKLIEYPLHFYEKLIFMMTYLIHKSYFDIFKADQQSFNIRFILDCYHITIGQMLGTQVTDQYVKKTIEVYFTHRFLNYEYFNKNEQNTLLFKKQDGEETGYKSFMDQDKKYIVKNKDMLEIQQGTKRILKGMRIQNVGETDLQANEQQPQQAGQVQNGAKITLNNLNNLKKVKFNQNENKLNEKNDENVSLSSKSATFIRYKWNFNDRDQQVFETQKQDGNEIYENICPSSRIKAAGINITSERQRYNLNQISPFISQTVNDGKRNLPYDKQKVIFHPIDRVIIRQDIKQKLQQSKNNFEKQIQKIQFKRKLEDEIEKNIFFLDELQEKDEIEQEIINRKRIPLQIQYGINIEEVHKNLKYKDPVYKKMKELEAVLNHNPQKMTQIFHLNQKINNIGKNKLNNSDFLPRIDLNMLNLNENKNRSESFDEQNLVAENNEFNLNQSEQQKDELDSSLNQGQQQYQILQKDQIKIQGTSNQILPSLNQKQNVKQVKFSDFKNNSKLETTLNSSYDNKNSEKNNLSYQKNVSFLSDLSHLNNQDEIIVKQQLQKIQQNILNNDNQKVIQDRISVFGSKSLPQLNNVKKFQYTNISLKDERLMSQQEIEDSGHQYKNLQEKYHNTNIVRQYNQKYQNVVLDGDGEQQRKDVEKKLIQQKNALLMGKNAQWKMFVNSIK